MTAAARPAAVVVVGDALLDRDLVGTAGRLAPDAPVPVIDDPVDHSRPGGAGLAAALAAGDGGPVTLVTALGADEAGGRVRALLEDAGDRPQPADVGVPDQGRPARGLGQRPAHRRLRRDPAAVVADQDRPGGPQRPPGRRGDRTRAARRPAVVQPRQ
jgi:hypothetical protein